MSDTRTGVLELALGDTYIGSAYSPQVEVTETDTGHEVAITYDDAEQGITTKTFDVEDGEDGADGFSPTLSSSAITGGHRVSMTDATGTKTFDVMDGLDGVDGYSPSAEVIQGDGSATITITDKDGTTTAVVHDGADGQDGRDGTDGADGFSPTATVTQTASGATISITDKSGTTTASVSNGTDGQDGFSPTASVERVDGGALVTVTDASGTTTAMLNDAIGISGAADALMVEPSESTWAQRTSTGRGMARVESVQGTTVVWNQLAEVAARTITQNGITFVIGEDGTITANGTATAAAYIQAAQPQVMADHKYLVKGCPAGGSGSTYRAYLTANSSIVSPSEQQYDFGAGYIQHTIGAGSANFIVAYISSGQTVTNLVFRPQLFDLTAMFGAGNEPQTVAEFERMFPEAHYPYSAPTLKPVQIAGIASTDAQGGELDAIEWTTQTLRAAGSVADMLYSDHVDVRVGAVDMGTLTWKYYSGGAYFYASVSGKAIGNYNILCAEYSTTTSSTVANMSDKEIKGHGSTESIYIKDSTYGTDPAALKAALDGAYLLYELATPTTTPISPALPMTYRVEQGGTESIIVPEGEVSAAPVLTVAEGESAAELVMDALACIAAPDGPVATANHAINTYLTMQGTLYKVTSAIAVGETIAAGTNVTQTTVMAELIARTA